MEHRTLARAASTRALVARAVVLLLPAGLTLASSAAASVISTTDPAIIAAFQSGRTVLGFDELVVPPGPCYIPLDRNQYAARGIIISALPDGSAQTNLARLPDCGDFGPTLTPPNIIGGGPGSWRESVRFDFPVPTGAIGASTDWTGSNTTLTAYKTDGSVIASVSGDQGYFMGIEAPDIAYAVWNWNYDEAVVGFSLDNVTFGTAPAGVRDRPAMPLIVVSPNPFDAEISVQWSLAAPGRVRVAVFDVRGRRVASLLDATRPAGGGVVRWDARDDGGRLVMSGIYFVRVNFPGGTVARRVLELR